MAWHCRLGLLILLLRAFSGYAVSLSEWLKDLVINIPRDLPPASLELPLGYHLLLDIAGGSCSGIDFGIGLPRVDVKDGDLSLDFSVQGLKLSCHISANASLARQTNPIGTGPISIDLEVGSGTTLKIGLRAPFSKTPYPPLPLRAELHNWDANIHVTKLHFTGETILGRTISALLDDLRPLLSEKGFINSTAYKVVSEIVASPLSAAIANFTAAVRASDVFLPTQPEPEPALAEGTLDWMQLGSGTWSRVIWELLVSEFHIDNGTEFRELMLRVLSFLSPNLPHGNPRLPLPTRFGDFMLEAAMPHCAGVGSLHTRNSTTHALHGELTAENAACSAIVNLSFVPAGSAISARVLNISTNMTALAHFLTGAGAMLVGLDVHKISKEYEIDQLQHLGCVLRSFANVTGGDHTMALYLLGLTADTEGIGTILSNQDNDPLANELSPAIAAVVNGLTKVFQPALRLVLQGGGATFVRNHFNSAIDTVAATPPTCPATNFSTGMYEPVYVATEFWTGGHLLLCAVAVAVAAAFKVNAYRKRELLPTHQDTQPQLSQGIVLEAVARAQSPESFRFHQRSLSSAVLSRWLSYALSFLTCFCIGLFLVSSTGMQVVLRATTYWEASSDPSQRFTSLSDLFDFTMWKVLDNFWNSKCYPLFFFVIIWSILWPIAKLCLMLYCWLAPTHRLRASKRGPILVFLDQIGKFSLFDPLLFTMFLGGFRLNWDGECSGSDCGFVMQAVPEIGFYFLFLGTVLSLFIGEIMLWCDRETQSMSARFISTASSRHASVASTPNNRSVSGSLSGSREASVSSNLNAFNGSKTSLAAGRTSLHSIPSGTDAVPIEDLRIALNEDNQGFNAADAQSGQVPVAFGAIVQVSPMARTGITILVLATLASTIVAIFAKSYAYDWAGIVGAFKMVINDPLSAEYSIIDFVSEVLKPYDNTITAQVVVSVLFVVVAFFVILAPCMYVLFLVSLWLIPLTPKSQYRLFVWMQIFNAWAAMDVFTISLFVSMVGGDTFGIASFVRFIIEQGTVSPICIGIAEEQLGIKCVTFTPRPLWGAYVLLVAAVLQLVTGQIIYRHVRQLISQDE